MPYEFAKCTNVRGAHGLFVCGVYYALTPIAHVHLKQNNIWYNICQT